MVVDVKRAAALADVHEVTLREWAMKGLIRARRLARGNGPWRVKCDDLGPLDGDGRPVKRRARR